MLTEDIQTPSQWTSHQFDAGQLQIKWPIVY